MAKQRPKKHGDRDRRNERDQQNDPGLPGGGAGRRDDVGGSGVYPMSAHNAPSDAEIRTPAAWGQGERGAEGYEDAGGSELTKREGQVLGGLSSGPDGRPEIDIHGGDRRRSQQPVTSERRKQQGSFGPGAGAERLGGRGGHERPDTPR
jgi:hypothetical protein